MEKIKDFKGNKGPLGELIIYMILFMQMAVDRNLWRNGSAPGRPTRVGMQTLASSRK